MSLSNTGEALMLDLFFDLGTPIPPTLYLAASTADPGEDGSGLVEPTDAAYARVTTAGADWERTGSEVANVNTEEFPEATESWGSITHLALMDASSAGNVLASQALTSARTVPTGAILRFLAGDITLSLD